MGSESNASPDNPREHTLSIERAIALAIMVLVALAVIYFLFRLAGAV